MHTTNYFDAFITIAPDSGATRGLQPQKPETIAGVQYALLMDSPYRLTSDELLFLTHAQRLGIAGDAALAKARADFFAAPRACLRASPLPKQYGWGLHHDRNGRVAMFGVDSEAYREFALRKDIKVIAAMRRKR